MKPKVEGGKSLITQIYYVFFVFIFTKENLLWCHRLYHLIFGDFYLLYLLS